MIRYLLERSMLMKNYIYGFFITFLIFISPTYANNVSSNEPTLQLNQLTYIPLHKAQQLNDTLYISGQDLASMTYGTYETLEGDDVLTIQNQSITYTPNSRFIKVNGISKTLSEPTYTLKDITYLPINVLDSISYPYALSNDCSKLSITPLIPYSTATDNPSSHRLYTTAYKSYEEALDTLLSESEINQLITESKQANRYISFMSTNYKKQCFEAMTELSQTQQLSKLQIKVHLRQLNYCSGVPSLSGFTTLPVSYKMSGDGLSLNLCDTQSTNNFFWSTYNPSQSEISIDLNKSLDTLIMRSLYTYYRDLYNLKDDLNTSPIITIQRGRSDQMCYRVYLDVPTNPVELQVVLYRMTTGKTIEYYIDLVAL